VLISPVNVIFRSLRASAIESLGDLPGGPRGYLVLAAVEKSSPPSQLALAIELGIDKTVMTYLLDELEAAGLVERKADPTDRRQRRVAITLHGAARLLECRAQMTKSDDSLLSVLSPAEQEAFREMLRRVADAVHLDITPCEAASTLPCG
jgi:DNA-binding MarR family transcriptional regulator